MPTTDLIGSAEACDVLRIQRSTLSKWVSQGLIRPAQRLPGPTGAFLFDRDDVIALRDCRSEAQQAADA